MPQQHLPWMISIATARPTRHNSTAAHMLLTPATSSLSRLHSIVVGALRTGGARTACFLVPPVPAGGSSLTSGLRGAVAIRAGRRDFFPEDDFSCPADLSDDDVRSNIAAWVELARLQTVDDAGVLKSGRELAKRIIALFTSWGLPSVFLAAYTLWTYFPDPCSIADSPTPLLFAMGVLSNRSNHTVISLDDPMDESFVSYRSGIGFLRWYCKRKGKVVDVSTLFGRPNLEVFTPPPPGGSVYVELVYKSRSLEFALWGRNLYVMGWRGPHGTVEIKDPLEQRKNFMVGPVIILPSFKNYVYLAPNGKVSNIRLGPYALREAFEVLYKYQGKCRYEALQAVGIIAANLSEPARLQCVYNDICICFREASLFTMDCVTNTNSLWVHKYAYYSTQNMSRIDSMKNDKTPEPICISKGNVIESDIQILNTIRILHRDGYNDGEFFHEECPSEPTEGDPDTEDGCSLKQKKGSKSANKRPRSDDSGKGDGGCPSMFPSYLLEWYPLVNVEESIGKSSDQNVEELSVQSELAEQEVKCADELGEGLDHVTSLYKTSEVTAQAQARFADFFSQFPAVRKMFDLNKKAHSHFKMPMGSHERITWSTASVSISSARQFEPNMKGVSSSSRALMGFAGRKFVDRLVPLQPHSVLRAHHFLTRFMRFLR